MSNPNEDSPLKKALAENGSFDPRRADELKRKAVEAFETKMRTVERWYWAFMVVICWLLAVVVLQFLQATTTKTIVMNGLAVLICIEGTVLMKLWYWVMNNKISVLKAIKQLDLREADVTENGLSSDGKRLDSPLVGLSRRERAVWWAALVGGCFLISVFLGANSSWSAGGALSAKVARRSWPTAMEPS